MVTEILEIIYLLFLNIDLASPYLKFGMEYENMGVGPEIDEAAVLNN